MKYLKLFLGILFITLGCTTTQNKNNLNKIRSIELTDVKGRIDHMSIDLKSNRLFIAALGNNTVEVVDLDSGRVSKSITGFEEPQGVLFYANDNLLFVASAGDGTCKILNANSLKLTKTIYLGEDADNIRFDKTKNMVFVGYGSGGIAAINPKNLAVTYKIDLPGHPESFQIDEKQNKMFVNIPDANQLDVIDLNKKSITNKLSLKVSGNFPMALDTLHQVIFIGSRNPSRLLSFDAGSLELLCENTLSGDADDIYYHGKDSLIFISCGGGNIDIFKEINSKKIILEEKIKTSDGARTSLFVSELNKFFLAQRKVNGHNAQIIEYGIM